MNHGADGQPSRPDAGAASLQLDARPKITNRSEHLDRLLGDAELLLRLQLSGYADREWQPVAAEFARYGLAILQAVHRDLPDLPRGVRQDWPQAELDGHLVHEPGPGRKSFAWAVCTPSHLRPSRPPDPRSHLRASRSN